MPGIVWDYILNGVPSLVGHVCSVFALFSTLMDLRGGFLRFGCSLGSLRLLFYSLGLVVLYLPFPVALVDVSLYSGSVRCHLNRVI